MGCFYCRPIRQTRNRAQEERIYEETQLLVKYAKSEKESVMGRLPALLYPLSFIFQGRLYIRKKKKGRDGEKRKEKEKGVVEE